MGDAIAPQLRAHGDALRRLFEFVQDEDNMVADDTAWAVQAIHAIVGY